ncbi:hypothetical protein BGZ51_004243 [Haplosporangium sp. Z 767]|nr:hypothetical protein BGZ50_006902 [Haplosporangium sp. Z 11]KAF9183058.1 hypothetical protein BGZ51_004243 [Haplosporangium sp. Z 767]
MKLNPLGNQVGGHDGVLSMGEENEIVVKPSLPQEHRFYEEAALHPELQSWMPAYYGSLTLTRSLQEHSLAVSSEDALGVAPTIKALNGYPVAGLMSADQDQGEEHQQRRSSSAAVLLQQAYDHGGEEVQLQASKDTDPDEDECLCLENVSHGFKKACVLDLKLGTQLYDDNASDEKKARLGAVSDNTTSGKFGIRLTGFQIYDSAKDDFTKYSKDYGKGLTENTILDGFRAFFSARLGPERMRLVIERFVNDLADFHATIQTQEVRMRSSSLLMVYEGDAEAFDEGLAMEQEKINAAVSRAKAHLEREDKNGEEIDDDEDDDDDDYDDDEVSQKVTDMRLIDFAHSTFTPGMGPDEGVVLGVKSALMFFERLLQEDYPAEA